MIDSRLILIKEDDKILSMLHSHGKPVELNAFPAAEEGGCALGSIYIGKVTNVVNSIGAAFLDLTHGSGRQKENIRRAFLPLKTLRGANLMNREYDGRILAGDEILVQVEKEAVKTKDPVVTTELSLSGRYCVIFPGVRKGKLQFSGKLSMEIRQELQDKLSRAVELEDILASCTLILRTNAGELADISPCAREVQTLSRLASQVLAAARTRTCCSCLYRPPSAWLARIQDTYSSDCQEILTDDPGLYEEISTFLRASASPTASGAPVPPAGSGASGFRPGRAEAFISEYGCSIRLYQDERISLRSLYGLDTLIKEALSPRVWLRCGGYLVIEPTEALTVIDVNSGKFNARKGSRDTFLSVNMEAAMETARQIRLRNLSGIILVDFINMAEKEDEQKLLAALAAELKKDPVKTVLIDMTPLGLVEITRKKVRRSLREQLEPRGGSVIPG